MEVKNDIYVNINDFHFFLCTDKINVNMNVFRVFFSPQYRAWYKNKTTLTLNFFIN